MNPSDECREAFEKKFAKYDLRREINYLDEYRDSLTQKTWIGWKYAWNYCALVAQGESEVAQACDEEIARLKPFLDAAKNKSADVLAYRLGAYDAVHDIKNRVLELRAAPPAPQGKGEQGETEPFAYFNHETGGLHFGSIEKMIAAKKHGLGQTPVYIAAPSAPSDSHWRQAIKEFRVDAQPYVLNFLDVLEKRTAELAREG